MKHVLPPRTTLPFVGLLTLAACLFLPPVAASGQANQGGVTVGARVGTTGYGPELTFPISRRVGGRLAAGFGSFDVDFDSKVVTYEGQVEMQNVLAVVDLFPTGGRFRLSAGALVGDNRLSGDAPVSDILLDNGITTPPILAGMPLGSVHAESSVEEVAPYVGIGFGRGPRREGGFHLAFDLGVAYHGEPEVDLELNSPLLPLAAIPALQPILDEIIAREERELAQELEEYRYFPVVALTLGYSF